MRTRDRDVRQAIIKKVLSEHVLDPDVLVVHELGLQHGACRIDIAVVNGLLHGYEIKSDADTLARLPIQVAAYSAAMDRATLVVGERHLAAAKDLIPDWWGMKVAVVGARGAVNIVTYRPVGVNPQVSSFHVAQLLWRNEAIELLGLHGAIKGAARMNRNNLCHALAEIVPSIDLRRYVRSALKRRENWRVDSPPKTRDDSFLLTAM